MKRQKEDAWKEKSRERATTRIFKETKNGGRTKEKMKVEEQVEEDDEAELKKHLVIKKDDDIAIDVIPLATKPPVIVDYKLLKEGIMHGDIRPEDEHERVLWADFKVMFEPDIRSKVWRDLQGDRSNNKCFVLEYQVLTHEIEPSLKPLEEIIWENVFCLGGNRDHVPACLCFMLYCAVHSEKFNLAYYMAKRIEWVTKQARLLLPYGMLLTRLFTFIMNENPELNNESYVLYDHVMTPLATQLERKPRRDRGENYGNDEGTLRASTPSPICYVNSLTDQVPQVFQNPPNIEPHLEPFYTRQTKIINRQVQLRDENRGGVRSIGKSLRRLWRNMKK
ncbi:hypothetical protein Tco_0609290 [Tanacetum coccineum]